MMWIVTNVVVCKVRERYSSHKASRTGVAPAVSFAGSCANGQALPEKATPLGQSRVFRGWNFRVVSGGGQPTVAKEVP